MRTACAIAIAMAAVGCSPASNVSRDLGARCDVTDDCSERCLPPGEDFPDGLCTLDCSDDQECPAEASCVDREGGVCLFRCSVDTDCTFLGPTWGCKEDNLRESDNVKVNICRGD
ncbi:MAG: hypothetical protein ABI867_08520 [Kofleriaceae bacterium]